MTWSPCPSLVILNKSTVSHGHKHKMILALCEILQDYKLCMQSTGGWEAPLRVGWVAPGVGLLNVYGEHKDAGPSEGRSVLH